MDDQGSCRLRARLLLLTLLPLMLAGMTCRGSGTRQSRRSAASASIDQSQSPAPGAVDDERRWRCLSDKDCLNSCQLGAVNAGWYEQHKQSFTECEDGCASQVAVPPRCVSGACVAFLREPASGGAVRRNERCTKKRD